LFFVSMLAVCMTTAYSAEPWQHGSVRPAYIFANHSSSLSSLSSSFSLNHTQEFLVGIAVGRQAFGLASNSSNIVIVFVLGSMSTESGQSAQGFAAEALDLLPQTPQFAFSPHRFRQQGTPFSIKLEARQGAKALSTIIERELGRL